MDLISECAANFKGLISIKYHCIVSKRRTLRSFDIDFKVTDFYHLAGFQYLNDIDISRDRNNTIPLIEKGVITDKLFQGSKRYLGRENEELDVSRRIEELRYLEGYLDTDNHISIFEVRDTPWLQSQINAEYVIKSRLPKAMTDVFIFLRKREENDAYGVVSFFAKKQNDYGGEKLYWMCKAKLVQSERKVLYQHSTFDYEVFRMSSIIKP